MFGISLKPDQSGSASLDQLADQPFTTFKVANQQTSMSDRTVSMSWDRKKRFPKDQTAQTLSSAVNGSPAEQEFFQVWYNNAYAPTTIAPVDVTFQYIIDYDVEFYELKSIPPS